jgi:glucose dehydrogenase
MDPALEGLTIGRTGKPTRAGILVTKTLVFAGEGAGGDPVLRAHEKSTGQILAEIDLPGSQNGLPMTYSLKGKQYIVLAVGGTPDRSAELVALTLPD